jgi:hypothetical protein
MKPTPHDGTDSPDATSTRPGIGTTSRALPPDPFGGTGHRQVNVRRVRQRELTRVRPITELELPSRATNALLRSGVNSVGQLISRSREDLLTEIIGLGEGTLKIIETTLATENLTLAPTESPSSTFTRTPTRRALTRAKTSRHIKNHNAWASSAELHRAPSS